MTNENTKRIAKNTMMLYIRLFLSMAITLYTSRIVLNTLGIENYGIYNVVAGVVSMFSFLNASMSGATSRFLTYELGNGNNEKLKKTFRATLTIHVCIAILIIIIADTLGLWFVNHKLVIPADRMIAANWVYQFSVIAAGISIMQVPFNACIIAHEKMDIYAYVEILNVTLKLLVVYLLVIGSFDKLILYGFLILCVSTLIAGIYIIYTFRHFSECSFRPIWEKRIMLPILSFSGWDLYGNLSVTATGQGTNILLNTFIGPVINAANGIAMQVQGAVMALASNLIMAVRPQIVKNYAAGNIDYMRTLMLNASKFTCLLLSCVTIPLVIEMPFVLNIWLKEVPQYTVAFCQLTLITNCILVISLVLNCGIHATGKIKMFSFITGTLNLMTIPVSYVLLRYGLSPELVYVNRILFVVLVVISTLYMLKIRIPQISVLAFLWTVIMPCIIVIVLSVICPVYLFFMINEGWIRFILVFISSILSVMFFAYILAISKQQRIQVNNYLRTKLKSIH